MATPQIIREEPTGPLVFQGRVVDSEPEYFVGVALTQDLAIGWVIQWSHFYGTTWPGDIIPDFVIFTVPRPSVLFLDGQYWHSGTQAEQESDLA